MAQQPIVKELIDHDKLKLPGGWWISKCSKLAIHVFAQQCLWDLLLVGVEPRSTEHGTEQRNKQRGTRGTRSLEDMKTYPPCTDMKVHRRGNFVPGISEGRIA